MYAEYTYKHEKVTPVRLVRVGGGRTECKSYSHPLGSTSVKSLAMIYRVRHLTREGSSSREALVGS